MGAVIVVIDVVGFRAPVGSATEAGVLGRVSKGSLNVEGQRTDGHL